MSNEYERFDFGVPVLGEPINKRTKPLARCTEVTATRDPLNPLAWTITATYEKPND